MAIEIIDTHNEEQWGKYRHDGLGASECSTILNLNTFQAPIQLFHKKLGIDYAFERNLKALVGQFTEQLSSDLYECFEIDTKHTMHNYNKGIKLRKVYKFPKYQYVRDTEKCKSLFVSPDRMMVDDNGNWLGAVEIKSTGFFSVKLYKEGISPSHIVQLKTQMAICDVPKGHLVTLLERDEIKLKEFNRDGFIVDGITEEDYFKTIDAFWGNILKARAINAQLYEAKRTKDLMLARELMLMLEECEPKVEDNNTLSFEKYVTEFYYENNVRKPQKEIEGTEEMYKVVQGYNLATQNYKEADKTRQMYKNKVLDMCKGSLDFKVKFSGKEYVQVTPTSRGISLKTNIK
jgi:hypothetical protein